MKWFIASIVLAVLINPAAAQTDTTFTYQGSLRENGGIANGVFNLDFRLWDALAGGSQIGSELMFNAQPVVDGRFTVELDFGGSAFGDLVVGSPAGEVGIVGIANNGNRRDIRFTDAGLALYTSNSPASPIAGNGLFINESGKVGIGTTSPSRSLEIIGSGNGGVRVQTSGVGFPGVESIVEGNGAIAIFGRDESGNGSAGGFVGDVNIAGTLSKSGGSFKIDHPLDPANKFLSHSFVESPDMMNIYNGNAILDGSGRATITLPDWFEALNREFRYQLTCIGGFATVYVESEIENNQFTIAGGNAGLKVSWQVTGVRQDAWAEANRIPVEEQKVGFEAGYYLHPEVYDLDRSMSILAAREAHLSVPEPKAAANEFQEEKQIETTASRITGKFHTPHIKRERQ